MRSLLRPRYLLIALLLAVLLALLNLGQRWRLFERGWFNLQQWQQEFRQADAESLWLPDYRVEVEALALEGLDDVSALTFDPERRSLFSVTNQNPELIELSLQGQVLRRIPLTGFGDAEAVEYISPGTYVISDERRQRLLKVHVDERTRWLDAADSEQLSLNVGGSGNKGFEGLAYDVAGHRLFVAKERDPLSIIEIRGFPQKAGEPLALHVLGDRQRDRRLFLRDLSSLQFDAGSGHLLVLSDESKLVLELDEQGQPRSSLSLLAGRHGLKRSVPQAEGLALDDQGKLYLVSEPNLFYVFEKATAPK